MYEVGEPEIEAIRRVILSKKLVRNQPGQLGECDQFEKEFSEVIGVSHSLLVTSGTNALVAALLALGVGSGDEVLVPAYTYVATAAAVLLVGARPVIVNIDPTLGICVRDAQKQLTSKTRAVIPVHMDGLSADLFQVCEFAKRQGLGVVEDCAQALGGGVPRAPAWELGALRSFFTQ